MFPKDDLLPSLSLETPDLSLWGKTRTLVGKASDKRTTITQELAGFLMARTSILIATASRDGEPYVQHRGGPVGFLRVLDAETLGFADFAGNRQYITISHLAENPRAQLLVIDPEAGRRVKIWGRARIVTDDADLITRLAPSDYPARIERAILFSVSFWDLNCRQHLPRLVDASVREAERVAYEARITALETELADHRARLLRSQGVI